MFRRLLKKISGQELSIMMVGQGVDTLMKFLAFVLYTRALSPREWGVVASVSAVSYLAGSLTHFGIDTSVVSLGSKAFGQKKLAELKTYCRTGFLIHLVLSSLCAALCLLASPWIEARMYPDASNLPLLVIGCLAIPVFRLSVYGQAVLRVHQRFRHYTLASVSGTIVIFVAVLILNAGQRLTVLNVLILLLLVGPAVKLTLSCFGPMFSIYRLEAVPRSTIRELLHFGKWVWGTSVTENGVRRLNVLFLQSLAGDVAAGLFDMALRYARFFSLLFSPVRKYLFPKFNALTTMEDLLGMLRKTYLYLLWVLLLIPIAFIAAKPVITGLHGAEWKDSATLYYGLLIANIIILFSKPLVYTIFTFQRPHIQTYIHLSAFILFITLAPWLITQLGPMGSVYGLLAIAILKLTLLLIVVRRLLKRNEIAGANSALVD
ncbi:MAG: oligosaccharide flippase family protein, partial [Verrucomicrobiota bacterium]